MRRRPAPRSRLLAPLAMMAAIFYLSAQPFEGDPLEWWEVLARKLGHMTGYALLTAAWIWALAGRVQRPLATSAAISFLFAVSDEYHQTFVENRSGTAVDVLIDSLGIGLALLIAVARRRRLRGAVPGARRASPASSP